MYIISIGLIFLFMVVLAMGCTIFHEIAAVPPQSVESLGNNSVTYIGHATVLIRLDGFNIITDPMFSDYIGWVAKRYVEPGIRFQMLPPIDAILISHEHYDHLHKPSLERFPKDVPVIIFNGLGKTMRKLGFKDVRELSWWESTVVKDVRITAVPSKHVFSSPSGYVVQGSRTVFFAGDTGLFDGFEEIGKRFSIDISLLPIGDYYPYLWFIPGFVKMTRERHMAPEDIPEAMEMLRTRLVIPIHWGTFKVSGTDLDEPIRWMQEIIKEKKLEQKVIILHHGETTEY